MDRESSLTLVSDFSVSLKSVEVIHLKRYLVEGDKESNESPVCRVVLRTQVDERSGIPLKELRLRVFVID